MTVGHNQNSRSLLEWGKFRLKESGIDDFVISAESLLAHVLNRSRSELFLNIENPINLQTILRYENFIEQRAKRVPLQYLIGYVEFYNVRIKCDRRALIPRPETEVLVEMIIERLNTIQAPRILDIGTGSGNIAVALAKNIPESVITGIDINRDALDLASENAVLNQVDNRISLQMVDILDRNSALDLDHFDCVVSNPPYVSDAEIGNLQPEVKDFEPHIALFSGSDPLLFYKTIIEISPRILKSGGLLAFEVGQGQYESVMAEMSPLFSEIYSIKDLAGIERIVSGIFADTDEK